MSIHSQIMESMFKGLGKPELKHLFGDDSGWNLAEREVLAAIDALADEQQPATIGELTDAAYGNLDLDGSDNTVAGEMRNAGFDGGML